MFVPSVKLLRLTALLVVPCALLAGLVPALTGLSLGAIVLFALLAGVDAVRGLGSLEGLAVTLPPVLRLTHRRPGVLKVQLHNRTGRDRRLHLGLSLPPPLESSEETRRLLLPIATVTATLDWPVTGVTRGRHEITSAHVEAPSPFGLWDMRRAVPTGCEVRVYPDLRHESRAVAAVFLNRTGLGAHARRQVGKGREFEKLRDYLPGDPVEDIHWKATAKRGRPVAKLFQIERTQEVYVLVDHSRLSARTAGNSALRPPPSALAQPPVTPESAESGTVLERSLAAALLLAAVAERQGDLFGVGAFDDQLRRFVRARSGRGHFAACRDALHHLQTSPVTPDFEEICVTLRLRLRRRALLVFLTALDDPVLAENFSRGVEVLARQHLVLVVQPRPPGARPMFSEPDVPGTEAIYEALGGHLRWQRLRSLEQSLRRRNVRFTVADHEALTGEIIRQYLEVKARQLI